MQKDYEYEPLVTITRRTKAEVASLEKVDNGFTLKEEGFISTKREHT